MIPQTTDPITSDDSFPPSSVGMPSLTLRVGNNRSTWFDRQWTPSVQHGILMLSVGMSGVGSFPLVRSWMPAS